MPMNAAAYRAYLVSKLEHCVRESNRAFDDELWEIAGEWDEHARYWHEQLQELDALMQPATGETA